MSGCQSSNLEGISSLHLFLLFLCLQFCFHSSTLFLVLDIFTQKWSFIFQNIVSHLLYCLVFEVSKTTLCFSVLFYIKFIIKHVPLSSRSYFVWNFLWCYFFKSVKYKCTVLHPNTLFDWLRVDALYKMLLNRFRLLQFSWPKTKLTAIELTKNGVASSYEESLRFLEKGF